MVSVQHALEMVMLWILVMLYFLLNSTEMSFKVHPVSHLNYVLKTIWL